jgi:hypothetical protein
MKKPTELPINGSEIEMIRVLGNISEVKMFLYQKILYTLNILM